MPSNHTQNIKKILRADFEKNPKTSLFRHFFRNFGKTGFFFKNRALSLFLPYNGLTSCAKAKKSVERFPRKRPNHAWACLDMFGQTCDMKYIYDFFSIN